MKRSLIKCFRPYCRCYEHKKFGMNVPAQVYQKCFDDSKIKYINYLKKQDGKIHIPKEPLNMPLL